MARSFVIRRLAQRLMLSATIALGLLFAAALALPAHGQHRGGGGGGGGFPSGGMGGMHGGGGATGRMGDHGGFPHPTTGRTPEVREEHPNTKSPAGTARPGLQLGPPSRWWDDKHFAKQLHITSDQQRHMDAIFEQNRPILVKRFEGLQQEEQKMEALTHANTLDENALFAQIDRVAQARAELAKANTHLLFQLRNEMNADQLSQLESNHESH